jgi:ribonuclease Y
MDIWLTILAALVGGGIGILIGRQTMAGVRAKHEKEAEEQAATIIKNAELQAENIKKDRMLEAKEKYLKLKAEFEETVRNEIYSFRTRINSSSGNSS